MDDRELRFDQLWRENAGVVLRYAHRQVPRHEVDDVVAETFAVAWRRLEEVPERALPWLLGVARGVAANARRAERRRDELHGRIGRLPLSLAPDVSDVIDAGLDDAAAAALGGMPPRDRELLTLLAWDGLTAAEAAEVVGCSRATFHVRLHRSPLTLPATTAGVGLPPAATAIQPSRNRQHRRYPMTPAADDLARLARLAPAVDTDDPTAATRLSVLRDLTDSRRHATSSRGPASSHVSSASARRGGWERRPLAARLALGGACAAGVAGIAAALVVGDPTAPPAYATWTPVPETANPTAPPSDADMATWASQCTDLGVGGIGVQGLERDEDAASDRRVLVDRRGETTFCVDVDYGQGTTQRPFVAMAGLRADGLQTMFGSTSDEVVPRPGAAEVLVLGGDSEAKRAAQDGAMELQAYQLYGLAGEDISGVDVILSDGTTVTATVTDGVWGLWYPATVGDPVDSRLEIHTDEGTQTVSPSNVEMPWPTS